MGLKILFLITWAFVVIADMVSTALLGSELGPIWSWCPLWIALTAITLLCIALGVIYWYAVDRWAIAANCFLMIVILAKAAAFGWNLNTIIGGLLD